MTSVNTNLPQDYSPHKSPEHTDNLQKHPEKQQVKPGTGGTIQIQTVIPQDGIVSIPDTVGRRERGTSILKSDPKTNAPKLEHPDPRTSHNTQANAESKAVTNLLFGFLLSTQKNPDELSDLEFLRSGTEIGEGMLPEDIEKNATHGTHVQTPSLGYSSNILLGAKGAISNFLNSTVLTTPPPAGKILETILASGSPLATKAAEANTQLTSTDPKTVLKALTAMVNWSNIPPGELTNIQNQISILADKLSHGNKDGGIMGLKSGSPGAALVTISLLLKSSAAGLPASTQEALGEALGSIAQSMSQVNLTLLSSTQRASVEFTALNGQDLTAAKNTLMLLLSETPEGKKTNPETLEKIATTIAENILKQNTNGGLHALRSGDPTIVAGLLTPLLAQANITENVTPLVGALSAKIGALNAIQLKNQFQSDDVHVIHDAFMQETGAYHDTTTNPPTQRFIGNYLQILAQVLGFMCQIRSKMIQLEGVLNQSQAAARINALHDQISIASKQYTIAMNKAAIDFTNNINNIDVGVFLKIFMPVICIVLALVAIVVAVVGLVLAIVSGGTSAAIACGVIAAIIGIIVGLVALAIGVTSLITTCALNTSFESLVAKGLNMDPAVLAGLSIAFEVVISILLTILTCGAYAAIAAAKIAIAVAKTVLEVVVAVVKAALSILKTITEVIITVAVGLLQIFLATGLVHRWIKEAEMNARLAKGETKEEAELHAEQTALAVNIGLMVAGGIAGGAGALLGSAAGKGKAASTAATQTAGVAGSAAQFMKSASFGAILTRLFKETKEAISTGINNAIQSLTKTFSTVAEKLKAIKDRSLKEHLASLSNNMWSSIKSYTTGVVTNLAISLKNNPGRHLADALQTGAVIMNIAASAIQADAARTQAEYMKSMAKMTKDLASMTAIMNALRSIGKDSYNLTMDRLKEAAEDANERWSELVKLVASFIDSASQMVGKFEQVAGR